MLTQLSQTSHTLSVRFRRLSNDPELSVGNAFPSGGVSLQFTKPVQGQMIAVNELSVCDSRLQNFNGMTWISDTCWNM